MSLTVFIRNKRQKRGKKNHETQIILSNSDLLAKISPSALSHICIHSEFCHEQGFTCCLSIQIAWLLPMTLSKASVPGSQSNCIRIMVLLTNQPVKILPASRPNVPRTTYESQKLGIVAECPRPAVPQVIHSINTEQVDLNKSLYVTHLLCVSRYTESFTSKRWKLFDVKWFNSCNVISIMGRDRNSDAVTDDFSVCYSVPLYPTPLCISFAGFYWPAWQCVTCQLTGTRSFPHLFSPPANSRFTKETLYLLTWVNNTCLPMCAL